VGRSAARPFVSGAGDCFPLRAVLLFVHKGWFRSTMRACRMAACSSRCGSAPTYATPRGEPSSRSAARTCAAYVASSSVPTMRRQSLGSLACHAATSRAPKSTSLTGRAPPAAATAARRPPPTRATAYIACRIARACYVHGKYTAYTRRRAHSMCMCKAARSGGRRTAAPALRPRRGRPLCRRRRPPRPATPGWCTPPVARRKSWASPRASPRADGPAARR